MKTIGDHLKSRANLTGTVPVGIFFTHYQFQSGTFQDTSDELAPVFRWSLVIPNDSSSQKRWFPPSPAVLIDKMYQRTNQG